MVDKKICTFTMDINKSLQRPIFISALKDHFFISVSGLILCITGEILRKSAMLTASTNFNHVVQTVKERDHVLVTHGVYSFCRHPSYVGWFYWSIGTQVSITSRSKLFSPSQMNARIRTNYIHLIQLILVNPLCTLIYTLASWSFFKTRVLIEEEALLNFFGDEYIEYKKRVHSGLPFNNGIQLEE